VAAHPLERAKSESKGLRESHPVRIKLDSSPQPSLDLDLFTPQGLTGRGHTFTRFGYFERLLTGNAKDKFCKTYKLASVMMLTKWEIDKDDPDQFKALSANRTLFAQWVFEDEGLNAYELTLPVEEQEALTAKLTSSCLSLAS
jgi:hypothetical protein